MVQASKAMRGSLMDAQGPYDRDVAMTDLSVA
jgi:hypothetical protein